MDSLLANYASSDEEVEERQQPQTANFNKPSASSSSIFTSLPPPKSYSSSSSLFNSLPPPKSNPTQTLRNPQSPKPINQFQHQQQEDDSEVNHNQSSSVFSSLPPPKTHHSDSKLSSSSSDDPKPKKIVQFKPPINTAFMKSRNVDSSEDDDDDDKEEKQRKRSKEFTQTSSVKSFLSAIPAPKNSVALGALSSSGSGRRSIIEADVPASNYNDVNTENEVNEVIVTSNAEGQWVEGSYSTSMEAAAGSSDYAAVGGGDPSYWAPTSENSLYYESNSNYENYGHYGQQYESKWIDKSEATSAPEISGMTESVFKIPGKRGRNEIPQDMVEVKQDELIKNRPREDQVKLTGIAFGPSYQPASSKGKPTKLHKRKHQIGSLYFDMRQKEMELAERRAKGFLTKSETQAKYGW